MKNTLPNEWSPNFKEESLKAGALVVKMYGWYAAYYPLANQVGADIYADTRSQAFTYGTESTIFTLP
ncbi:hypothetical protein [Paenibacillus chitinolyticus]|uniref:hypothetical protein n=1 Tax=Paenibacillus chitinolyticus TaxID=79263 RepID=UPI001C46BEFA|nr:hypothetical protein [Paenibacillus chitinolyticus]